MNKEEFCDAIKQIDIYDKEEYNKLLGKVKHNICQNMRIARKLSGLNVEDAAILLDLEPQSLRRIEAVNDRDEFSSKVLIMAVMVYEKDANFYFNDWKENQLLLYKKKTIKQYN